MLRDYFTFRSSHQRCSIKKVFLEISQNSHNLTKQLHQSLYFNKVSILIKVSGLQLIKKDTLAQVFSCEFCEISKNAFSYRTPPAAASDTSNSLEISEDINHHENFVWAFWWLRFDGERKVNLKEHKKLSFINLGTSTFLQLFLHSTVMKVTKLN